MVTPDVVSDEEIPLDNLLSDKDIPGEPPFRAYIEAKVYDKEGHVIQYHRQPMKSLTEYFLALMTIPLIGTYQNSQTNQAPSIFTNITSIPAQLSSSNATYFYWMASIQVGSGTQSFSLTLNGLAVPIANGTGTGELQYGTISVNYAPASIFISVTVFNNSGGTINVTEIGLFGTFGFFNYSTSYTFLLSYDTLSSAVSIPNGALATFQVTLTFSG
jgi:hypothetical protein